MDGHWINGTVAIVTGGGSGIGQAIAIEAANHGCRVVIADINTEGGRNTNALIRENAGISFFVETDVCDVGQIESLVRVASEKGMLKYIANSAGCQTYGTVDTTTEESWDVTMNVNLKSMFLINKAAVPEIRKNGGGGIVNISSIQGLRCQKNVLAYATAKGGVIALTRSMGIDHAKEGIYINCICPGSVDTPMLRYGASKHGPEDQVIEEWGSHHPIGRIGSAEEIAKTTMFLWGPDSNFIIGQAIIADGGLGSVIL